MDKGFKYVFRLSWLWCLSWAVLVFLPLSSAVLSGAGIAEKMCDNAIALTKDGKLKAAQADFEKVLSLAPDNLKAHYYLYRIERQRGNIFKSMEHLKEVLTIEPAFRNSDRVFQEFVPSLLPEIRKRLKVNRNDAQAQHMLGFILIHAGRAIEGIKKLHFAVKLNPLEPRIYDDLAWGYYKVKMFDKALLYSQKAFNLTAELPSVSAHYKKLFYIKKFGQKVARTEQLVDFYPPPRTSQIVASANGTPPSSNGGTSPDNASAGSKTPSVKDGSTTTATGPVTNPPVTREPDTTVTDDHDPFKTGDAMIEFSEIDLDDDKLMNQLMAGVEVTDSTTSTAPETSTQQVGTVEPDSMVDHTQSGPVKVPSPVATLKKLNKAYEEGENALTMGNFDSARQSFSFVYKLQPDFKNVKRLYSKSKDLSEAYESLNKGMDLLSAAAYKQALTEFKKIGIKELKQVSSLKSLDHLMGECLYRQDKYSPAATKFEKWLKLNPDDGKVKYMLGRCYYELGDHQGAYEQISFVRSNAPDVMAEFPGSKTLFIKIFIKKSIFWIIGAAVIWFLIFFGYLGFKLKGVSDASVFKEAFTNISNGVRDEDWDRVLEICDSLEGKKAGNVERFRIEFARAQGLLGKGKASRAVEVCQKLLSDYPDDQMTHSLLAKAFLATGASDDTAIAEYRNLLAVEPNNMSCLKALASYYQANQIVDDDAENVFKVLNKIDPDDSEYQLYLCNFYLMSRRFGVEESSVYMRYLENNPSNIAVREGLAHSLVLNGDALSALRECNEIIKIEPLRRTAHELLLSTYRKLSMYEEALTRYKSFASQYEDEPYFGDQVKMLEKESVQHREQVMSEKKEGKDSAHYYNRGVKLYSEGKYDEAISPLRAAFRSPKLKIHSGNLLVRSLLNLDQPDEACRVFKEFNVIEDGLDDEFIIELSYEMASVFKSQGHKGTALSYYQYISQIDVEYKDVFKKIEDLQEELKLNS